MSKSSKSGLTGSGQRPRRPIVADEAVPAWRLQWLDELDDCCDAIETVARLLEDYGGEALDGTLARGTGFLIAQKACQLKALREKMGAAR